VVPLPIGLAGLRGQYRSARSRIPETQRREMSGKIAARVLAHPRWRAAKSVFCYLSAGSEAGTTAIIEAAFAQGKRVCVPRVDLTGGMDAVCMDASSWDTLVSGAFGILEPPADVPPADPDSVDLAIIPGLAFTRAGQRVGMGAGYYDRWLAASRAYRMALAFPQQVMPDMPPAKPWDVYMDTVILPDETLEVARPAAAPMNPTMNPVNTAGASST